MKTSLQELNTAAPMDSREGGLAIAGDRGRMTGICCGLVLGIESYDQD